MSKQNYTTASPPDAQTIRKAMPKLVEGYQEGKDLRLDLGSDLSLNVPPALRGALLEYLALLSRGEPVAVVPFASKLTTQSAADLLTVSRPHLIKLLERGDIPFEKVGKHRRVRFDDVIAYRDQRSKDRRQMLAELMADDEEQGLI